MVRFDAYTATTQAATSSDLLGILVESTGLGNVKLAQGKGFHTFAERVSVKDSSGHEVGAVSWGGRQGDRVMIEVKGEATPKAVERLRSRFPHRVTRVDACADFDAPRAFSRVLRACQAVKRAHGIWGERRGDWEDHPEKGRTFYLGANTSPTRSRLYEKGLQPEYAHLAKPNWVRLELQVRPQKDAKTEYAKLEPMEVWGSSRWARDLAVMVLKEHVDPHPAGTVYRRTDLERRIEWICTQAGPTLMELLEDCGTWENVGLTLGEAMRARQR